MEEQRVLLDTFVAKLKLSAALCRGDRNQAEIYAVRLYTLTSGADGHFTAAATGEGLATRIIEQIVYQGAVEYPINYLMMESISAGYAAKRLESVLAEVLDNELIQTLGHLPIEVKRMIAFEVCTIAMDASRREDSNAVRVMKSLNAEKRATALQRAVKEHAPWIGKLITGLLKSVTL